jgi:hypothetical protein
MNKSYSVRLCFFVLILLFIKTISCGCNKFRRGSTVKQIGGGNHSIKHEKPATAKRKRNLYYNNNGK